MNDIKLSYRHDVQGIRAIAIMLVIIAHAKLNILTGGFIGVDVFFVLSGYLITGLLLREYEDTNKINFLRFYSKRLKRLFPALLLMLCVSTILAIWILSGVEARQQLATAPYAITWTSNIYLALTTFDYFDELSSRDLFLHTWSLGVEEQFYLIWPALIMLLLWLVKLNYRRNINLNTRIFFGLGMAFTISLILSNYWTINNPQAAFYQMPSRIWQFSLGGIVYITLQNKMMSNKFILPDFKMSVGNLLLVIGLAMILGSAVFLSPEIEYPGYWALLPSVGTAILIIAGSYIVKPKNNLLAHPILVWIGDRSYSLYLWHWPIFMLGFSMGFEGQLLHIVNMILLTLILAIFSYRLIEIPFWKGQWSQIKPGQGIFVSLFLMSIALLATTSTLRNLPDTETTSDISFILRTDIPEIYHTQCDAWFEHARVEPCFFGSESADKSVAFIGDSIGAQWYSMIPEIFARPDWRIIVFTKSSCAIVDEDFFYDKIGAIYQVCTDWRNAVLDEIDEMRPDVLIIGSASTYNFSETQWTEGSSRIFNRVSKSATSIFVIAGTPSLGFDGPGCISRHLAPEGFIDRTNCSSIDRMDNRNSVTRYIELATDRFQNVFLLDLNNLVCPNEICNAITEDGIIVFRDSQHLTDSFVRSQVPYIRQHFESINK